MESFFRKNEERLFELVKRKKFIKEYFKSVNNVQVEKIDAKNYQATLELFGKSYVINFNNGKYENKLPHYYSSVYFKDDKKINKNYVVEYLKTRKFLESK